MPIHDQGYRRYGGQRRLGSRSWWVIARAGILERLRERRFLGLLAFAWAPFVVRAVQIYVASSVAQASFLAATPATFREFISQQGIFVFFITIYVGAGLVANDRRANALQIYLSRPLTRLEYVMGKLVTLVVFLLTVTWLPAMLLLVLQVMFTGSSAFLSANLFLIPAITLYSALQILVSASAMLALSSLSKNRRFVSMMYAGIVFFTAALAQVLRTITNDSIWGWISPNDTLGAIADRIFRVRDPSAMPLPLAVAVVLGTIAVSFWILARRVRGVEVVA